MAAVVVAIGQRLLGKCLCPEQIHCKDKTAEPVPELHAQCRGAEQIYLSASSYWLKLSIISNATQPAPLRVLLAVPHGSGTTYFCKLLADLFKLDIPCFHASYGFLGTDPVLSVLKLPQAHHAGSSFVAPLHVRSSPVLINLCDQMPPLPGKLTPLHIDHQGGLMEQSYASLQRGG
jgi:hypothetical protein